VRRRWSARGRTMEWLREDAINPRRAVREQAQEGERLSMTIVRQVGGGADERRESQSTTKAALDLEAERKTVEVDVLG
jgi:hypothetical protein